MAAVAHGGEQGFALESIAHLPAEAAAEVGHVRPKLGHSAITTDLGSR